MKHILQKTLLISALAAASCGPPPAPSEEGPTLETSAEALSAAAWSPLSGLNASTGPGMVSAGGALHLVAISTSGTLSHRSTVRLSDDWNTWSSGSRPSATPLAPATSPVLLTDNTNLLAFARGADNNLYMAKRSVTSGSWTWTALTTHGRVRGRISIALSRRSIIVNGEPGPSVWVTHVAYTGPSSTVETMRLEGSTLLATSSFSSATDATLGSNGGSEVWLAVHGTNKVTLYRAVASGGTWTWSQVAYRGSWLVRVYDVSELTWFAGAFHLLYSARLTYLPDYNTSYRLYHARFIPGSSDDGFYRILTTFAPTQDPDTAGDTTAGRLFPEATLAVYRNKLVAAYRMDTGSLRYARWDNADPTAPWIGNKNVGGGYSRRRPALAPFNARPAISDYAAANYSDDLFSGSIGYSLSTIHVIDFSRAIFKQDVGAQFNIYTSNSDSLPTVCVSQDSSSAPTLVSIADEDRAVLSEIGFNLWMLPNWFSNGLFREVAQDFCYDENPDWVAMGRAPAPCSAVKMPVIVRSVDDIFVCQGAWIGRSNSYIRVFEELGHYAAEAMGLGTVGGPAQENADRTGIDLTDLTNADELFSEGIWACSGTTRCTGFTGYSNNYDLRGTQHSFLYVVYFYVRDGGQLRTFVNEDLAKGSDLLQRKYNWVRDHLFHGIEFTRDSAPLRAL